MRIKNVCKVAMVIILLPQVCILSGQQITFENPSIGELAINEFQNFPGAEAVILKELGSRSFHTNYNGRYMGELAKRRRIKIISEAGKAFADVSIPYYDGESVREIKAVTFNLEHGKVIRQEIDKSQIFRTQKGEKWWTVDFSLPNVKVGSIIEYGYIHETPYIHSPSPWYFQHEIPALSSEFVIYPHPNLAFSFAFLGNMTSKVEKVGTYRWRLRDVPPIIEEGFVTTIDDYRQRIVFQLSRYNTGQRIVDVAESWEDLAREIRSDGNLLKRLKKDKKLDEIASAIQADISDPLKIIEEASNFIRKEIEWNKQEGIYSEEKLMEVLKKKSGSTAAMNLLLIYFLRSKGLDANPALISTRDNGLVIKDFPLMQQFNRLICHIELEGQSLFFNLNEKLRHYMYPAEEDLNFWAWVVGKKKDKWVKISTDYPSKMSHQFLLKLDTYGHLAGRVIEKYDGYPAFLELKYAQMLGDNYKQQYLSNRMQEIDPELFHIKNEENGRKLELSYPLSLNYPNSNTGEEGASSVYFSPFFWLGEKEHPFKTPNRNYPIDFGYPYSEIILVSIAIPQEWEFSFIPENQKVSLPNGEISYQFLFQQTGNMLSLRYEFAIKESLIHHHYYKAIQEIFDYILAKQGEQIVIRKKKN